MKQQSERVSLPCFWMEQAVKARLNARNNLIWTSTEDNSKMESDTDAGLHYSVEGPGLLA